MTPERTKALVDAFPRLYEGLYYFEHDDGWFHLLWDLSEQLTKLVAWERVDVKATQVKEKFGDLRYYVDESTEIMDACIDQIEQRSRHTCEFCGSFGHIRGHRWVKCLCVECALNTKGLYDVKDYELSDVLTDWLTPDGMTYYQSLAEEVCD